MGEKKFTWFTSIEIISQVTVPFFLAKTSNFINKRQLPQKAYRIPKPTCNLGKVEEVNTLQFLG
jgi:hypothetical protein